MVKQNRHFNCINEVKARPIDTSEWAGCCSTSECTLHQISPYIGKIKSIIARRLIEYSTRPGDVILDPFAGSGTVPLESLILGRHAIANDINPYAITLTKAKMFPPSSMEEALEKANRYLLSSKENSKDINLDLVPEWVKGFFHPDTLRDILAFRDTLKENQEDFLLACLLGILHHQRPGFLSYPSSHLVPYLRTKKYPVEDFPELYAYRDVQTRINKKIIRAYRRFPMINSSLRRTCVQGNAKDLSIPDNTIDAVISSPPYMNTLDYARDNRLRLWLLGEPDYKVYDSISPNNIRDFQVLMKDVLTKVEKLLKLHGTCVFVLGDIQKSNKSINTATAFLEIADKIDSFQVNGISQDQVPNLRRARRDGSRTKNEWFVVLEKVRE